MRQTIKKKISDRAYLFPTLMSGHAHLQSAHLPIEERDKFMIRNGYVIPEGIPIIEIINESDDGKLKQKIIYRDDKN